MFLVHYVNSNTHNFTSDINLVAGAMIVKWSNCSILRWVSFHSGLPKAIGIYQKKQSNHKDINLPQQNTSLRGSQFEQNPTTKDRSYLQMQKSSHHSTNQHHSNPRPKENRANYKNSYSKTTEERFSNQTKYSPDTEEGRSNFHNDATDDYKNITRPIHKTKEFYSDGMKEKHQQQLPLSSLRIKQFWPPSAANPTQNSRLTLPRYANRFEDLQIPSEWIANMKSKLGINLPTDTQMNLFRGFFAGQDVFIRCKTGTGKTLAALLAVLTFLHRVGDRIDPPSALLVLPTIPLAKQVYDWTCTITGLKRGSTELERMVQLAIPPVDSDKYQEQQATIIPQLVIGVPSQFSCNPSETGAFSLLEWTNLRVLVLDEADRLIGIPVGASQADYSKWLKSPGKTVRWLEHMFSTYWLNNRPLLVASSATLNQGTRAFLGRMSGAFEKDDSCCTIVSEEQATTTKESIIPSVSHQYSLIDQDIDPTEQPAAFLDSVTEQIEQIVKEQEQLSPSGKSLGLVFMSEQAGKQKMKQLLEGRALRVEYIQEAYFNSNLDSHSTDLYLTSYSEGYGLDIPDLQYVIILGKPVDLNSYIHMSGRVGRFSSKGANGKIGKFSVITILSDQKEMNQFVGMLANTNIKLDSDNSSNVLQHFS